MSLLRLAAAPERIPAQATQKGVAAANISCSRTLLRLRVSSLLARRPTSSSQDRRSGAVLLSVDVPNQTSNEAPPATTPACVKTIVAIASLRRTQINRDLPPPPASCAPSQSGSWRFSHDKARIGGVAATPEPPTPSNQTALHGATVIRHAHRRSRLKRRSAYRLPRLPNPPIDVENPFSVQLEVTHFSVTDWTHWSPGFNCGGRVPGKARGRSGIHSCP